MTDEDTPTHTPPAWLTEQIASRVIYLGYEVEDDEEEFTALKIITEEESSILDQLNRSW